MLPLYKSYNKLIQIPHYDLDDIYWIHKFDKKRSEHTRVRKLLPIVRRKKWILEGVYGSWTEEVFRKAEILIWLDIPFRTIAWRIIKRDWLDKDRRKQLGLKDTLGLLKYARSYKKEQHTSSYSHHTYLIKKHHINVIILKNKREVYRFIKEIEKDAHRQV